MIDTKVTFHPGEIIWLSDDAPNGIEKINAFWSYATGGFNPEFKSLKLEDIFMESSEKGLIRQSSSIHARSVYLGQDLTGMHFFAKGTGWIQSTDWNPKYPSIGILPKWAALREKNLAKYLASNNIKCTEPVAIIKHLVIPSLENLGGYINSNEIKDLDGSVAEPSIYIYKSHSRWRLADLPFIGIDAIKEHVSKSLGLNDWVLKLISDIASFTATLHNLGGHDYSLSLHNIFTDGTKVDFEYVYCPEIAHSIPALNEQIQEWQMKEVYSLKCLAWEICELLKIQLQTDQISNFIEHEYKSKLSNIS